MKLDLGYFLLTFGFSLESITGINTWWCGPIQLNRFKSELLRKGPSPAPWHCTVAHLHCLPSVWRGVHWAFSELREGPKWLKTMVFVLVWFRMSIFWDTVGGPRHVAAWLGGQQRWLRGTGRTCPAGALRSGLFLLPVACKGTKAARGAFAMYVGMSGQSRSGASSSSGPDVSYWRGLQDSRCSHKGWSICGSDLVILKLVLLCPRCCILSFWS